MNIKVELLECTPIEIIVKAIRQCYESINNSDSGYFDHSCYNDYILGPKDQTLIERIIDHGHTSTLEHVSFNFQIKGISRLNLQELSRHRICSPSVKSTRYTLKELKKEDVFWRVVPSKFSNEYDWERASKYINLLPDIEDQEINIASIMALENLRKLIVSGKYSNDKVKYCLPECYKVDLIWTINVRSLRNFLQLRLAEQAHFEIRELAKLIEEAIPENYKFLFKR